MLIGASGFSPNLAGSPRKPTSISSHPLTINVECFARDDLLLWPCMIATVAAARASPAASTFSTTIRLASACARAPPAAMRTMRSAMTLRASSSICHAFKPNDNHGLNIAGKRLFRCWAMNPNPSSNALGLLQVERIEPQ